MNEYILVKLVEFGDVKSYSLTPGSTVDDLFKMAEKEFIQGNVTIRHNVVTGRMTLSDGDKVYNGRALKGNQEEIFDVDFIKIGGGVAVHIGIEDGMTVKEAIDLMREEDRASFFKANGDPAYEFRIGGIKSSIDSEIPRASGDETQRVLCTQKLKGNE